MSAVYLLQSAGNNQSVFYNSTKVDADVDSPYPSGDIGAVGGRGWSLHDTSMPELARFLSDNILHKQVVDCTDLKGSFDFRSSYILTDEDFKNDVSSTFLPVIKEMGLKLETSSAPVESLVIDRADPPIAN